MMRNVAVDHAIEHGLKNYHCLSFTLQELEALADLALGKGPGSWVRKRGERGIIAHIKFGADAASIGKEFEILRKQVEQIIAKGDEEAGVRAVGFFFLRFLEIHPLKDGNGRTARMLLAADCARMFGVKMQTFLDLLTERGLAYRRVFETQNHAFQYELLLDLLGQLLGLQLSDFSLPMPLALVFSEKDQRPDKSMKKLPLQRR